MLDKMAKNEKRMAEYEEVARDSKADKTAKAVYKAKKAKIVAESKRERELAAMEV